MIAFAELVLGLAGLWGGTLLAVRGAVRVSERYGISEGFVGLIILAFGTDLPELVVALDGSLQQLRGVEASGVIVGAAVGSAIAQGSVVLGIAGMLAYLPVAPRMVRRDGLVHALAIGVVALIVLDGAVTRVEGLVLLAAYGMYLAALLFGERHREPAGEDSVESRIPAPLEIVIGLTVVTLAAHLVVGGGLAVAAALGVTQTLLGVILIGVGTSLPELALSVRAAAEKRASMSVGNVIGSNIFDLLVPMGMAAAIHPLTVERGTVLFDLPCLAILTATLLYLLTNKRGLQRWEAMLLIGIYVTYAGLRITFGLVG